MRAAGVDRRRRQAIAELSAKFGRASIRGVEVGVYNGRLANALLKFLPNVRSLWLVDSWREFPADHPDRQRHAYARRSQAQWDETLAGVERTLAAHKARTVLARMQSLDAARLAADMGLMFHFAYVDAGHYYADVLGDMAWFDLILPGGMVCGDDYQGTEERRGNWGVGKAVDEFAKSRGLTVRIHGRNWFIDKPGAL